MDVSKYLAKVMGLYLIIISLAMLVNMSQFIDYVNNLINNAPLMFVAGFFTIILGLLVVVGHNIWQLNWKVIITILGWVALIKGIAIIFYPQFIDQSTAMFVQNVNAAYVSACIDLILGIILCYFGFKNNV